MSSSHISYNVQLPAILFKRNLPLFSITVRLNITHWFHMCALKCKCTQVQGIKTLVISKCEIKYVKYVSTNSFVMKKM